MQPVAGERLRVLRDTRRVISLLRGSRQEILRHLAEPDSASGLARRLGIPRQRLNYHLRALERDGLVELVEERRKGNCVERIVRASARAFVISPEALGEIGAGAEKELDRASAAFQVATAARAIREVSALESTAAESGRRLVTLTLDSEIRFADARSRAAFATELADTLAKLLVRHHAPDSPDGRTYRLTAFVHPVPPPAAAPATPASTAGETPAAPPTNAPAGAGA
jgi:DNA-binding transcriptional ArsR family regulator